MRTPGAFICSNPPSHKPPMPRIKLALPDAFPFETEIPVRISDINYGGHLGNDALLSIIHEARIRFLHAHGYKELDIEGRGIIMADAVVVYAAEAFHGDVLRAGVAVRDIEQLGCDIVYRLVRVGDGREVARAKTGIVFFDYVSRKPVPVPDGFRTRFSQPG